MSTNLIDDMTEGQAKELLNDICAALGCGGRSRNHTVVLSSIENAIRRSDCLARIETYLSVFRVYDDDDDDGEGSEVSLLNWSDPPDKYLETFKDAIRKFGEVSNA